MYIFKNSGADAMADNQVSTRTVVTSHVHPPFHFHLWRGGATKPCYTSLNKQGCPLNQWWHFFLDSLKKFKVTFLQYRGWDVPFWHWRFHFFIWGYKNPGAVIQICRIGRFYYSDENSWREQTKRELSSTAYFEYMLSTNRWTRFTDGPHQLS